MDNEEATIYRDAIDGLGSAIAKAYRGLKEAARNFHMNTQIEIASRNGYAEARAALLLRHGGNPKELGANEAAREAAVNVELYEEYATLTEATKLVANFRYELTIAQLSVDSLRAQLRCFEVIAQLGGEKGGL